MDYKPKKLVEYCNEHGVKVLYKPVRYTSLIKPSEGILTTPKTVDLCFVGMLTMWAEYRQAFIDELEHKAIVSFKGLTQVKNMECVIPEMNMANYQIDIPRKDEMKTQNQVRLFELISRGYTVLAKKAEYNMFPGMIFEYETFNDVVGFVNLRKVFEPKSLIQAYKNLTYTDEAYEKYINYLIQQQETDGV